MKFEYAEGATPLDPEDMKGLIPRHLTTQGQLNEWEQANILIAEKWAYGRKHRDLLTVSFLKSLHKKMFDKSWTWAGEFRTRQTNIGVAWHQIPAQLKLLMDDTIYFCVNRAYSQDEIAVRFHHRLVLIHPFPNGNGRHARLIANLLALQLGEKPFSWGLTSKLATLTTSGNLRTQYLKALRQADQGEISKLLVFARS